MGLKQFIFAVIFTISVSGIYSQTYNPISYAYNGTPTNGVKIKTNIPFAHGVGMPTILLEGYAYGEKQTINVTLNWYVYNSIFHSAHASSYGSFAPNIKLLNDSGMVSIFIDERVFYMRFNVRVFAKSKGETAAMFEGWTAVDEPVSGTSITDVPYESSFSKEVVVTNDKLGIGTTEPQAKLNIVNPKSIAWSNTANSSLLIGDTTTGIGIDPNEIVAKGTDLFIGTMSSDKKIYFRTGGTSNRMVINEGGYIGVGTNFPSYKLDVVKLDRENGKEYLTGAFRNHYGGGIYFGYVGDGSKAKQARLRSGGGIDLALGTTSNTQAVLINNATGNVGIGTANPQNKLSVNGTVWATKVKVTLTDAADWVFEDDYNLRPLTEVENYIKTHKHLPEIPSAEEFRANDMEVSEMTNKLLQKIEELTLYTIAQDKELKKVKKLENEVKAQNEKLAEMDVLKERLAKLEALLVK